MRFLITLLCFVLLCFPAHAASTVTAVYNTVLHQVVMIVVDATNLSDPSYNPPDCIQIPIDAIQYNTADDPTAFVQSVVDQVTAQMNP